MCGGVVLFFEFMAPVLSQMLLKFARDFLFFCTKHDNHVLVSPHGERNSYLESELSVQEAAPLKLSTSSFTL